MSETEIFLGYVIASYVIVWIWFRFFEDDKIETGVRIAAWIISPLVILIPITILVSEGAVKLLAPIARFIFGGPK